MKMKREVTVDYNIKVLWHAISLRACGIHVVDSPADIGATMVTALKQ